MAHGIYPPGTIDAKGPIMNVPLGYHHNWIIQSLPYLEEQNTWKAIDKSLSVYDKKNAPVVLAMPRIMNCPSSASPRGNACYAGVHHDQEKPIDAKDNGVFFLNSLIRYDDVSDGSAHTLFLGEKIPDGWDLSWLSGTRATLRNTGPAINALTRRTGLLPARAPKNSPPSSKTSPPPKTIRSRLQPPIRPPPRLIRCRRAGRPYHWPRQPNLRRRLRQRPRRRRQLRLRRRPRPVSLRQPQRPPALAARQSQRRPAHAELLKALDMTSRRGYPLGALFVLVTACAVLAAGITPLARLVVDGDEEAKPLLHCQRHRRGLRAPPRHW